MRNATFRKVVVYMMIGIMVLSSVLFGISFILS
ncbi:stressosome-associated protein Prli42 [Paenisporosarcina cavernae]|nr:stressosome-associated protein Prli42 [Paenisporosarcina cavernae]